MKGGGDHLSPFQRTLAMSKFHDNHDNNASNDPDNKDDNDKSDDIRSGA